MDLRKLIFFSVIISLLPTISSFANSYGEEDQKGKWGFSFSSGIDQTSKNDLVLYAFLPRFDIPLFKKWILEFEGNFSYYDIYHSKNLYLLGINTNILFKPIQWDKSFHFLIGGGGLAYCNNSNKEIQVREMGDSHIAGTLQIGTGIQYYLGKGLWLRGEYRFCHISDPTQIDTGINTHNLIIGISF